MFEGPEDIAVCEKFCWELEVFLLEEEMRLRKTAEGVRRRQYVSRRE
jgi:hypothetical protein